jgi:AAA15 family ATPase/GTPase
MVNNHLTYFKVENFKKFDSLEVTDIGQFNLIVGDNNVGKTCLLEALLFDKRPKNTVNYFHDLLVKRRLVSSLFMLLNETNEERNFETNTFAYYQRDKQKLVKLKLDDINYSFENVNIEIGKSQDSKINDFIKKTELFEYDGINKKSKNWLVFRIDDDIRYLLDLTSTYYADFINRPENHKIPNIPALMLNDEIENYLGKHYDKIFIELDLSRKIAGVIKLLFPNIEIIEFQKQNNVSPIFAFSLMIKTKERSKFHNIREYGEGLVRSIYIIIQILSSNSNKILVDEIDTGIHHKKLMPMWQTLLKICQQLAVQLFTTTHSQECAEAYVEAIKDLKISKDCRLITLREQNEKVVSYTKSIEELDAALENDFNFRG